MRLTALLLLISLAIAATLVLICSHTSYAAQDREAIASGPTAQHWTGTDDLGRDRTVRLAGALLLGLAGASAAAACATSISFVLGAGAAFAPHGLAAVLLFVSDLFLTIPWLFLLMIVRSSLPLTMAPFQSALVTFILLGLLGWPAYVRMSYARTLSARNSGWLIQGRAAGLRPMRLLTRHILPHLRPLLLTQFLVCLPACLVAEANLGILGLGISEPLPSWGSMLLALESSALLAKSNWVLLPIALLVTVLLLLELLVFEVTA